MTFYYYIVILHYSKEKSFLFSGKEKRIFNVSVTLKIQVRSYFMDKAFADEMISEYQKK